MKKKKLSGILAAVLFLSMLPQAMAQPDIQDDAIEAEPVEITGEADGEPMEGGTGTVDSVVVDGVTYLLNYRDVDFTVESPDRSKRPGIVWPSREPDIPSAYSSVSSERLTPVKNQNPYGTCWAFSVTAAAETSCRVHNNGDLYELSPLQLVNFFYHDKVDPLGNASGDATEAIDSSCLDAGNNDVFAMWGLAGWTNGAREETLPYNSTNFSMALAGTIPDEYAYAYDVAHLQNAYIIPWDGTDISRENIKRAIMEYGMVATSYHHADSYMSSSYAYCCDGESNTNHAVAIVGWNDDYPVENFGSHKPAHNGAWLMRNSWGSDWGTDGDADPAMGTPAGYFWLSYEDSSLLGNGVVFVYDFSPASKYRYNYQYDGSCGATALSVYRNSQIAAVYEVKGQTSMTERIDAVGIGIWSADVSGTVSIYVNPEDGKPTSGTKQAEVPFNTSSRGGYSGFYTIELPNGVRVHKGDTYSVVFEFDDTCQIYVDRTYTNGGWIGFTSNTENDKTYFIPSVYSQYASLSNYTYRIKAYTNDVSYVPDFDGNGTVDEADLSALLRHVAGIERITDGDKLFAADINGDGNVNAADVTALAQMLAE